MDEYDAHRIKMVEKAVTLMTEWTTDTRAGVQLIEAAAEQALGPMGDPRELVDLVAGLVFLCDGLLIRREVESGESAALQLQQELDIQRH